jgi:hypothetical protein
MSESLRSVLREHCLTEAKKVSAVRQPPPLPDWVKGKSKAAQAWVQQMMNSDPLIADYYLAKTEKEAKKALDTYKSIRAGSKLLPKIVMARKKIMSGELG